MNTVGPEQDTTGMEEGVEIVLGVAGMELNFLLAAPMVLCAVLCLGGQNSVENTLTLELLLSSACTASRPSLFLTRLPQREGWEGTKPGQLTPADQRDIPHQMTSWSAVKLGRGCVFFAQRLASVSCCE